METCSPMALCPFLSYWMNHPCECWILFSRWSLGKAPYYTILSNMNLRRKQIQSKRIYIHQIRPKHVAKKHMIELPKLQVILWMIYNLGHLLVLRRFKFVIWAHSPFTTTKPPPLNSKGAVLQKFAKCSGTTTTTTRARIFSDGNLRLPPKKYSRPY